MDADRFDGVIRAFASVAPRRQIIGGVLVACLTGVVPRLSVEDAASKRRKRKKKKCKGGKKKCGKKCIAKSACCTDTDCAEGESCCSGQCTAPVFCGEEKTCGCNEICRGSNGNYACHHRACPNVNHCNNELEVYYCGVCDGPVACCVCTTSFDGTSGCVDYYGFVPQSCASDNDCTEALGQPALCIPGGPYCPTSSKTFCAPLCTGGLPLRAAG